MEPPSLVGTPAAGLTPGPSVLAYHPRHPHHRPTSLRVQEFPTGRVAAVFGRSRQSSADAAETPAAPGPGSSVETAGGKGRPTPKRREAERGRRRSITAPPRDRKAAYKEARARQREERMRSMQALRTGDERHLPPRDRGPVRRYVRDVVDARRSVAEFFLPMALVILVLSFTSSAQLRLLGSTLWMVLVVLIIIDSIVLVMRLKRGLRRTHPDEPTKGAVPYALMRSMQIRRFRLPPPRVKAGRRRRS